MLIYCICTQYLVEAPFALIKYCSAFIYLKQDSSGFVLSFRQKNPEKNYFAPN